MIARYALGVAALAVIAASIVAVLGDRLGQGTVRGTILGAVVASAGAIGGMALLARSLERGPRRFLGAMLLGILGRMLLFGAVLIYVGLRRPAGCSLSAVGLSMVGFFFVFQALEVRWVQKRSRVAT